MHTENVLFGKCPVSSEAAIQEVVVGLTVLRSWVGWDAGSPVWARVAEGTLVFNICTPFAVYWLPSGLLNMSLQVKLYGSGN
jgi:hypothetical protein